MASSPERKDVDHAKPTTPPSGEHGGAGKDRPGGESIQPSKDDDRLSRDNEAAENQTQEPEWAHGFKLFNITAAVTLVFFLIMLDGSVIVTAIPRITDDFHSLDDVGWYGAAYQLGSAVFQPLTGTIYMKFKTKWTFLSFFTLFEIGSLICALASSSNMLIGGRTIAGVGTSGLYNGALVIIAECAPLPKRPTLIGIVMGFAQLGLVSGPLFGALLTQYASWRWCFYLNLPIGGLVAIMVVVVQIPQQHPRAPPMSVVRSLPSHLDFVGFAIFAPVVIMLLLALEWGGNTFAWNSAKIIGLFCGAGGLFIPFLFWDYYKGDAALFPFNMVRKRPVWASSTVYGLFSGQLYTAAYWIPLYFQGVKGKSPLMSGVYILPMIVAHIASALSSGLILNRVGYWIPVMLFASTMVAVGSGLISTFSTETSVGKWIGFQIILGIGRGLGIQMPIIAVQNTVTPAQIPLAMALVMFSQSFGAALFLALAELVFTNSFTTLLSTYAPSVNSQSAINAGATGLRSLVSKEELPGVLIAYAKSVDRVFYLTAGIGVSCFVFAWAMGWKNLRAKKGDSKA